MTIPKLLFSQLRHRSRPLLSLSTLSHAHASYFLTNHSNFNQQPLPSLNSNGPNFAAFHFPNSRSFWSRSNSDPQHITDDSVTELKVSRADGIAEELFNGGEESVLPVLGNGGNIGEESILPIRTLISLLDEFHDFTGWPWWVVIVSTTVVMRLSLMPLIIFHLKKLGKISELLPRLPPPFPPPFSGRSYIKQFSFFNKEKRAMGCPSFLWFFTYLSVQFPCFILWVTTIRRMCLDHHAGFDCGGALWFQNLTEFPHGVLGPIFPLLVIGLHNTNVVLAFREFSAKETTGTLSLLAKYYRRYLDVLTFPLFCIAYCIPQGSLVYWVTNSSLHLVQQRLIKNSAARKLFGLPDKHSPRAAASLPLMGEPEPTVLDSPNKEVKFSAESLSPGQLFKLSRQLLSQQEIESAMVLLRAALEKDPDFVEAMIYFGWTLLKKELHVEATELLERAISKLCLISDSKEVKNQLILASQWAGFAYVAQGKKQEGILHFERVAHMGEPKDPTSKEYYFDTLVFLARALNTVGRKPEAIKYLQLAVAYDSSYRKFLEECENAEDIFGKDLANTRAPCNHSTKTT